MAVSIRAAISDPMAPSLIYENAITVFKREGKGNREFHRPGGVD